jgi:DNA primase catalytic subunit
MAHLLFNYETDPVQRMTGLGLIQMEVENKYNTQMREKINLIIDRSLANSLDNNLEDIMDWNKLEKNLEGLEFEVAPDQFSFYLNNRPVTTRLGWIGSEAIRIYGFYGLQAGSGET